MEIHNVLDPELIDHNIQTTAEETPARRANSVHVYESIPPSPIADISFSGFADDTEFDAVTDEPIEDAGRYENLDQNTREGMAYNINFLDQNTREDVMNTIYSHGQHTEDTTHYINLNL
ncbi:hypothetical protein DPMN_029255 [Dreissena polymorpha]|uniref:Uncharacterized protein n=2 Tax=Dreissena polymorpha TaxID=45954 RepID=A0A9D4LWV5_DREPO|nr:hypothetical protein DPMN_029255 [Dreissena polymorpha]